MSDIISLGLWIKRRRKALDLTQAALAQRVGCSLDLIQKIEADARRPSREMAARLADMLDLAADERTPFIQAARAELGADRLAPPTQSITRGAFVPTPAQPAQPVSPPMSLPIGTVTFLFTDIAGSTRLWEEHPQAMPATLARHDALLKAIVAAHSGVVFKTVGDSVLAAFARASDALAAALDAQRAVGAESWALPEPLLVRMALHTGSAELRDGDYFGPALNRAARLLAAGHGGQVLLSLATEQLLREQLPPATALRDLSTHRLKDLSLPEQIFQLLAADLVATFPALQTLDARRTNLPAQPTALLGREPDVAAIVALLRRADVRLVTLTGPGGIGKTRLSLQIGADITDDFDHGVYIVDLTPIREPEAVISAIATTLGVREAGRQPLLATLKEYLRDKRMLLLLDNFEQVLNAAPLVAELLASAAQLKVLVTSREMLHLRGEHEVAVPSLAAPDIMHLPELDQLSQYAAVTLFIQRVQASQPSFQVTNATAPAVAEICWRLDGLPLAIELAAARVKLFPPQALLVRLGKQLNFLTGGPRDLPARQQTMRNTIAWSYDLLNEDEQALFRRLGVFVGRWTLEAAEAICVDAEPNLKGRSKEDQASTIEPLAAISDSLAALIDKSLVRQIAGPDGEPRFTMLETIREYALERLEMSGEAERLRRQHAVYYETLSAAAYYQAVDAETGLTWQASKRRLQPEFENMQSALAWSQTTAGDAAVALQLALALRLVWSLRGVRREAIAALESTLNHPYGVGRTVAHYQARVDLAELLVLTGNYTAARMQYEQALPISRELGDTKRYAMVLERVGWLAREQGDSATAWARITESLAIFRELRDTMNISTTLTSMAGIAILEEDGARAEALLAESQTVVQHEDEDPFNIAWRLNNLGHGGLRSNGTETTLKRDRVF